MQQYVYRFDEGNRDMKAILGGKGANLAEMTRLGFPVPKGFTISTKACLAYLETEKDDLSEELVADIDAHVEQLEEQTGKKFGDEKDLLLVSVRSGAKFSMPGMMDTILNLGLNDENVQTLAKFTQDERFAYDCYRRLLQMFGDVVYQIDSRKFEDKIAEKKQEVNVKLDYELSADDLKELIEDYKKIYQEELGFPFPQEVKKQITEAVRAVFKSWNNNRARVYRRLNHIPDDLGTAVNIQEMVFGNRGENSGTGVLFTRNPATGENEFFGEYLRNAQGEDVVAGIRTPEVIAHLEDEFPDIYKELYELTEKLEQYYHDMQDIEFTLEEGKLYILQTRNGKRTAKAAVKIAVDMVKEGIISEKEAVMLVDPESINQLLHPTFDEKALKEAELISDVGLAASPGAATGQIVFDAEDAMAWSQEGKDVILVRHETSPEDIEGMSTAQAIVTSHGGMTSHAAVVARGMGKCCVAGCGDLQINEDKKIIHSPVGELKEGDVISCDGSTGNIYLGDIAKNQSLTDEDYQQMMAWATKYARLQVRMNAETAKDIEAGYEFEANGIGLVRTEHMFFQPERLKEIRHFILSASDQERQQALDNILGYQTDDFYTIFKLSGEHSTTIRLLDPPLHEFLPHLPEEIKAVADQQNVSEAALKDRIRSLTEVNPMLGHRGCRLAMTYPELYEMQVEAIIRGAMKAKKEEGFDVKPEIMIPLVSVEEELARLRERLEAKIKDLMAQEDMAIDYTIGTMIEIPRACFIADDLAHYADFYSFGTNDLTQLNYGYSRDDAGKFINQYLGDGTLPTDPFQVLDEAGVGELMKIAVERAHRVKPDIKLGVCGELGGNPQSIRFFDQLGLDYVSCSPFRIPVARLAAAQSALTLAKDQQ